MAANEGYLKALLALSGDAMFSEARKKLVESLSEHELEELIQQGLMKCTTRKLQEGLSIALLDYLVEDEEAVPRPAATANGMPSGAISRLEGALIDSRLSRLRPGHAIYRRDPRLRRHDLQRAPYRTGTGDKVTKEIPCSRRTFTRVATSCQRETGPEETASRYYRN
jgi:hypothetical protein